MRDEEDEEDEPDRFVKPDAGSALDRLYALTVKSLGRVATAMRRSWRAQEALEGEKGDRAALARSVAGGVFRDRLRYRREAEARRTAYLAAVGPRDAGTVREPVWIALDLGGLAALALAGWGVVRGIRRLRRKP